MGMEIGSMAALKYYVQANFGVAVVPVITASPAPVGTVLRPIHDLDSGLVTGLLFKQGGSFISSAADKLIDVLRKGLQRSDNDS